VGRDAEAESCLVRQRIRGVRKIFHLFGLIYVLGFTGFNAFPGDPKRNPEFLPLSWDEMRQRTGGAFPQFYPREMIHA